MKNVKIVVIITTCYLKRTSFYFLESFSSGHFIKSNISHGLGVANKLQWNCLWCHISLMEDNLSCFIALRVRNVVKGYFDTSYDKICRWEIISVQLVQCRLAVKVQEKSKIYSSKTTFEERISCVLLVIYLFGISKLLYFIYSPQSPQAKCQMK